MNPEQPGQQPAFTPQPNRPRVQPLARRAFVPTTTAVPSQPVVPPTAAPAPIPAVMPTPIALPADDIQQVTFTPNQFAVPTASETARFTPPPKQARAMPKLKLQLTKRHKFAAAGIAVAVLAILGGVTFFHTGPAEVATVASIHQVGLKTDPEAGDITNRSDGKLDLTSRINVERIKHSQGIDGKLNQQLNMADGFSFMVTKVEPNWKSPDPYAQPAANRQFVAVHVMAGYRGEQNGSFFNVSSFRLRDSKGGLVDTSVAGSAAAKSTISQLGLNLQPGQQGSGIFVYEVKPGEIPAGLVYHSEFTQSAQATKPLVIEGRVGLR